MNRVSLGTVGHGSTTLWYLTRSTGLVAFVVLSATVVMGLSSSIGWAHQRWPRFASQALHRNLSLLVLVIIVTHVATTVGDGYVPIGFPSAVVPFLTPYRPLWVGLGAVAFDLLLAVAVTSALRHRIGVRAWRGVHWLAYLCWPIAFLHALGSGTDTHLSVSLFVHVLCVLSVCLMLGWRLAVGRDLSVAIRTAGALGMIVVLVGVAAFTLEGPLKPGWSRRAGTSSALLAQLSASTRPLPPASHTSTSTPTGNTQAAPSNGMPALPFSTRLTGTISTSRPNEAGQVTVVLTLHLQESGETLLVKLIGTPVDGGVAMDSSSVIFGPYSGTVTTLEGSSLGALLHGPGGLLSVTTQLNIDSTTGMVTGSASGASGR